MRFLVVTIGNQPAPPEMAEKMTDAIWEWASRHRESGKMEAIYHISGQRGGCGILNVKDNDELDEIMAEFPAAPFSETTIYPIAELKPALDRARKAMVAMMKTFAPKG
jgi:muconolactone delta-isomerase